MRNKDNVKWVKPKKLTVVERINWKAVFFEKTIKMVKHLTSLKKENKNLWERRHYHRYTEQNDTMCSSRQQIWTLEEKDNFLGKLKIPKLIYREVKIVNRQIP